MPLSHHNKPLSPSGSECETMQTAAFDKFYRLTSVQGDKQCLIITLPLISLYIYKRLTYHMFAE